MSSAPSTRSSQKLSTRVAAGDAVDFDAAEADQASLTLARASPRARGKSGNIGAFKDVDGDGDLDLVVPFPIADLNLSASDTTATLKGQTVAGEPLQGSDAVVVLP